MKITSKKRVSLRIKQLRKTLYVDTQHTRRKLIKRLEEVFKIASDYARGKIRRVIGDDGEERPLTVVERQFWARIAAYTAQIINNVAKGIDERQIDEDLDKLEAMLNKTKAAGSAPAVTGQKSGCESSSGTSSTAYAA
jgi:hypothetical protein